MPTKSTIRNAFVEVAKSVGDSVVVTSGKNITNIEQAMPLAVIQLEAGSATVNMARDGLIAEATVSLTVVASCDEDHLDALADPIVQALLTSDALFKHCLSLQWTAFSYELEALAPNIAYNCQFAVEFNYEPA